MLNIKACYLTKGTILRAVDAGTTPLATHMCNEARDFLENVVFLKVLTIEDRIWQTRCRQVQRLTMAAPSVLRTPR